MKILIQRLDFSGSAGSGGGGSCPPCPPVAKALRLVVNHGLALRLKPSGPLIKEFFHVLSCHNRHLKKCLVDYGSTEYAEWVLAHPGQAVLTVVSNRFILLVLEVL